MIASIELQQLEEYLVAYYSRYQQIPSVHDISREFGWPRSTIYHRIKQLEVQGKIKRDPFSHLAVRPVGVEIKDVCGHIQVPVLGSVSAGASVEIAQANRSTQTIELPIRDLRPKGDLVALKVTGTSMLQDGFSEGDTIVIDKGADVRSGDISVVLDRDTEEAFIKRVRFNKDLVYIEPRGRVVFSRPRDEIELYKVVMMLRKMPGVR